MAPVKNENALILNLNLEKNAQDSPRQLTIQSNHIIANGGDNGNISALSLDSMTSNDNNNTHSNLQIIQQYDDPVKALAFSDDGQRVAVGYDDGCVDIYVYSAEEVHIAKTESSTHPFLKQGTSVGGAGASGGTDDDEENEDDAFLTQSSQFDEDNNLTVQPTFRVQHRFESTIRDLKFRPNTESDHGGSYYLAIASESNPGFMIANVTSDKSFCKYLHEDASATYDQGGVKSLGFSPHGNVLMTCGMNGKLAFWSVKGTSDPALDWELLSCDDGKIIPDVDTGDFSTVAVRCTRPSWSPCGNMIGIPGNMDLRFRKNDEKDVDCDDDNNEWLTKNRMVLNLKGKTNEDGIKVVALAFDPMNTGLMIASTRDGNIGLWKIDHNRKEDEPEGKFVKYIHSDESLCTHIVWHKNEFTKKESLFLALQNGTLISLNGRESFVPKEKTKMTKKNDDAVPTESQQEMENELNESLASSFMDDADPGLDTQPQDTAIQEKGKNKSDGENGEYEGEDVDYLEIREEKSNSIRNEFVADEAEENEFENDDSSQFDDVLASKDITGSGNQGTQEETGSNDKIGPDDDDFANDNDYDDMEDFVADEHINNDRDISMSRSMYKVRQQAPFTPSSTPLAERTIFCWNHIGVLTSRDDGSHKSIDVSFTDTVANRPVSFRDNMDFVMGSLGEKGAIFATDINDNLNDGIDDNIREALDGLNGMSDATKDVVKRSERRRDGNQTSGSTGSSIYFHCYDALNSSKTKHWWATLSDGEKVVGCATGEGWNAVITSRRFLRTFTSAGLQGPVVWLKGDPITVVGRGRLLAVFHHESSPLMDGTQKIGCTIYDGMTTREISSAPVAGITSGSMLSWVGFSSDLALAVMDDSGMLSMLMSMKPSRESGDNASFSWIPMIDTVGLRKSKEDSFWPVCVQNGKLLCVPLKGVLHPNPARRPITSALQLRIPLVKDGNNRSIFNMEEVAVRAKLALEHKNFVDDFKTNYCSVDEEALEAEYDEVCAQVDKITLKLFFKMLESSRLEAALDLVHRLHLEKSFEIAMESADRSRHPKLSDKIYAIKEDRFNQNEEDASDIDDADSYMGSVQTFTNDQKFSPVQISPEGISNAHHQEKSPGNQKKRKRTNPFATVSKISPGKTFVKSPTRKPKLSRMSTFSAESRRVSKASKEIL